MDGKTNQIFDKVLKRILTLSQKAVVGFINGLFDENFPIDSVIGYNETENINDNLEKTIADVIITINGNSKFHIESQINNDSEMVIRVFEYGLSEATRYKVITPERIKLFFPEPKIIFLEHNDKTPNKVVLELNFGKKGFYEYEVSTMKFLSYSVEELNEKNMVILLPLYLLKLRKDIIKNPTKENAIRLKKLLDNDIIASIENSKKLDKITSEDTRVLIGLLDKIYEYLYGNVKLFKEEKVKDMLADRMVLEFEEIREKTRQETKKEMADKMVLEFEEIREKTRQETKKEMADKMVLEFEEIREKTRQDTEKEMSDKMVLELEEIREKTRQEMADKMVLEFEEIREKTRQETKKEMADKMVLEFEEIREKTRQETKKEMSDKMVLELEEIREKTRQETENEISILVVKNMLKKGMDIIDIQEITRFSIEKIKEIQKYM